MVDVDQLKAMTAIAETGSITAAAKELGMSQPGLSRLVERVEDEFDASLFDRGRRGAELTQDGRKFIEFARSTLTEYGMLRASVSGNRRRSNGSPAVVKIVASTTPGEYLLPQIASDFTKQHDGVSVDTLITDSAAVASLLLSGEYDAGFAGQRADFGALNYVKIARDEVVLAVPSPHRFASLDEIDISDLVGEQMLRRESGSGTYEVVESVLEAQGKILPDAGSVLTLGSTQAVVSAVDGGLGVGFVTLRAIEHHAASRVAAVRIAGTPMMRDLFLVYENERRLSESAMRFIEFVQSRRSNGASIG